MNTKEDKKVLKKLRKMKMFTSKAYDHVLYTRICGGISYVVNVKIKEDNDENRHLYITGFIKL